MPTHRFAQVLLLPLFLLITSETRSQTTKAAEKVTLAQAREQLTAKADEITVELEKQASKLAKTQTEGILNKKSGDARAAFMKVSQQRMDAVLDSQSIARLATRHPDAVEMKTVEQWLDQARKSQLPEIEAIREPANDPATEKRVKDTPKEAEASIESLATYLTKDAKSDREKARAIFLWVADNLIYDMDGASRQMAERRPAEILKGKSTDCGGYSVLFRDLARAAGLEANLVIGIDRVTTPDPALAHLATQAPSGCFYIGHAWNVVKIDGTWQLVDATLACGRIRRKDTVENAHAIFPYYFCTPPSRLILSHFPLDEQWQLLKTPISKVDQQYLPQVYGAYFDNGLRAVSHPTVQVNARKDLWLTFRVPRDVTVAAALFQDGKRFEDEPPLTQRQGDLVDVRVVFPKAGKYIVRIFASKVGGATKQIAQPAIDYLVDATPGPDRAPSLPSAGPLLAEKEGRVYLPLTGTLKAGQSHAFLIHQPGASVLMVLAGSQTVKLTSVGNGLFAGNVELPAGPVTVRFVYTAEPNRYYDVVRYKAE